METVQFSGEDAWDAIVNHNSLDIEEEDSFLKFCESRNIPFDLPSLETAFEQWQAEYRD
jgi:hypothetical protein